MEMLQLCTGKSKKLKQPKKGGLTDRGKFKILIDKIRKGDEIGVANLLPHVNVNLYDGEISMPALHEAIHCGNFNLTELLIEHGADVNMGIPYSSYRYGAVFPILLAIQHGCSRIVHLLLQNGCSVRPTYNCQQNLLHEAVKLGRTECVKVILIKRRKHSLDMLHEKDKDGITPWDLAIQNKEPEILMQFALSRGHAIENCETIVKLGMRKDLKDEKTFLLFLNKTDVKFLKGFEDEEGMTLLHHAAKTGKKEAVDVLLGSGLDVDKVDSLGQTALHKAVLSRSIDVVTILVKAGASTIVLDLTGASPLDLAVGKGQEEMEKCLMGGKE